jgi:hypothetical protein
MGMTQIVRFPSKQTPPWPVVRELLARRSFLLQIRMIDGELAFPDEEPSETWRELRVATQDGQAIAVKRATDHVELVVWGNADQTLMQARNALAWAFAEAGQGLIESSQGEQDSATYWNQADLPIVLRP